jgi:hypothetical protein
MVLPLDVAAFLYLAVFIVTVFLPGWPARPDRG